MNYRVELTSAAEKQLRKLPIKQQTLIVAWLMQHLENSADPRRVSQAKKLEGVKDGWRWRIGNYRVLGIIEEDRVVIEVFKIGHRRDVYRGIG